MLADRPTWTFPTCQQWGQATGASSSGSFGSASYTRTYCPPQRSHLCGSRRPSGSTGTVQLADPMAEARGATGEALGSAAERTASATTCGPAGPGTMKLVRRPLMVGPSTVTDQPVPNFTRDTVQGSRRVCSPSPARTPASPAARSSDEHPAQRILRDIDTAPVGNGCDAPLRPGVWPGPPATSREGYAAIGRGDVRPLTRNGNSGRGHCLAPAPRIGQSLLEPMMASASISTSMSGSIRRLTSTMLVAGRMVPQNSPWTRPTSSQREMSVTNMRVRTTSFSDAPARSSARSTLRRVCTAWARMSPAPTTRPLSSVAVVPETLTTLPTRTAREYP